MNPKRGFSLFFKLAALTGALTLMAVVTSEMYFVHHERAILELALREKINFITNYYALGIAEALERQDDITLQQIINGLEQDHDVTSVIVVDGKGEIRYHIDPEKVGSILEDPLVKRSLDTGDGIATPITNSGGRALELVAPLKIRGKAEPAGAVRLDITYRHINDEVHSGPASFEMMGIGVIFSCIGGVLWGFKKWVLLPMAQLRAAVMNINPALLEANLPEADDEFGEINKSINALLMKLKTEWTAQRAILTTQPSDERILIEGLVRGLEPQARTLLIDKDNRVVCDTARQDSYDADQAPHLLDLVTDDGFSTLLATAMREEGGLVQGPVLFQEVSYQASILPLAPGQTKIIRTIIVLKPISDIQSKKEAV